MNKISLKEYFKLADGSTVADTYDTPAKIINLLVSNVFVIAGIIIFIAIFVAGFNFLSGDKSKVEESKKIATTAVIGFFVMFGAYWIIQIIKVLTGADIPI
jgi:hypothetical protein